MTSIRQGIIAWIRGNRHFAKLILILLCLMASTHFIRIASHSHPAIYLATVRWVIAIITVCYMAYLVIHYRQFLASVTFAKMPLLLSISLVFVICGGIFNATVVMANGGYMPVLDSILETFAATGEEIPPYYIPTSEAALPHLGDVHLGGMSIGDFFLWPAQAMTMGIGIAIMVNHRKKL